MTAETTTALNLESLTTAYLSRNRGLRRLEHMAIKVKGALILFICLRIAMPHIVLKTQSSIYKRHLNQILQILKVALSCLLGFMVMRQQYMFAFDRDVYSDYFKQLEKRRFIVISKLDASLNFWIAAGSATVAILGIIPSLRKYQRDIVWNNSLSSQMFVDA